eukprot:Nk52_evm35s215 gene=Nk52_evmTU35s215
MSQAPATEDTLSTCAEDVRKYLDHRNEEVDEVFNREMEHANAVKNLASLKIVVEEGKTQVMQRQRRLKRKESELAAKKEEIEQLNAQLLSLGAKKVP